MAKRRQAHNLIAFQAGMLFLLFALNACSTYRPMPLTAEAVRAGLQPPDMKEVRVLAAEIRHPILPPVVLKADEGLSPDGAAVLAVLLNPSLRAARDQRGIAEAQLLDAGLLPDPVLTASLDLPTGGDTAGRVNAFGLGLGWDVTSLITRTARMQKAKASAEAVDLEIAWREWQVAQAAKAAVYSLSSLRTRIILLEDIHRLAAGNLADVEKAVSEGSLTERDLNAARAAEASVKERLIDASKQADEQRLALLRLLGLPADETVSLDKNIQLPVRVEVPDASALLHGLERRRLDLVALRRGYDSQEEAVRAAVLAQFPRITIGPTFNRDTDNIRTTGFGVNIVLPIFNRNRGKIAIARATRKKLYDEYLSRVFAARMDVEQLVSGFHFLNEQVATAQAMEAGLGKQMESYDAALAAGRIDAPAFYQTSRTLTDARIKVVDLKEQLAQAAVALELATGLYDIPGQGSTPSAVSTTAETENKP